MNSLKKISVTILFPLGANFYQNIVDYTYKQFLRMLKNLSCINMDGKCKDCECISSCRYFYLTGENFEYYPGIIFKKDGFENNIFHNNEEYIFEIYIVGDCDKYRQYIDVFFEEYLNHKLAGHFFNIKKIEKENISEEIIKHTKINICSIIENNDFLQSYNQMVNYYNDKYGCHYNRLSDIGHVSSIKNINLDKRKLLTKTILLNGYLYRIDSINVISSDFIKIGVGKYNYIGGGKIEIKD